WWEGCVQRSSRVDVQVVEHHPYDFGIGICFVHQPFHLLREVHRCASLGHLDMPPASQRFDCHEHVARAVAPILVVQFASSSWRDWNRFACMVEQLQRPLVEADHWTTWVVALGVQVEDVFHGGYKGWTHFRDAPVLLEPRFEPVFLSVRRTASSEMAGTTRRTTNSSASSCIVHEVRPSGGLLHAKAISV